MIDQFLLFIDNKDKIFKFFSGITLYFYITIILLILLLIYLFFKYKKNNSKVISGGSINIEGNNNFTINK